MKGRISIGDTDKNEKNGFRRYLKGRISISSTDKNEKDDFRRYKNARTDQFFKMDLQVGWHHHFSLPSTDLTVKNHDQVGYKIPLFTLSDRPDSLKKDYQSNFVPKIKNDIIRYGG